MNGGFPSHRVSNVENLSMSCHVIMDWYSPNRVVSQMLAPLAACREPAGKLWQLCKVLYEESEHPLNLHLKKTGRHFVESTSKDHSVLLSAIWRQGFATQTYINICLYYVNPYRCILIVTIGIYYYQSILILFCTSRAVRTLTYVLFP